MRRRTVLAALGGTTAALLSGCVADETPAGNGDGTPTESPTETATDAPTETPTDEPTATPADGSQGTETDGTGGESAPGEPDVDPTIVGHDVETTGAECASGEESDPVNVSFESDGVTLDGVAAAPNPCHEATIESASVEAGELVVRIGLESTGEMCVECVGAIRYSARIDVDGADGLDAVVLEHEDGETYTVPRDGDEPSPTPTSPGTDTDEYLSREAANEPDPDLPINVTNRHDETHEVSVTIARESGETVYDETVAIEAGEDREIYNIEDADPDGVEAFDVRAAMDGQTESVRVETSACYGLVDIGINGNGEFRMTYAIC